MKRKKKSAGDTTRDASEMGKDALEQAQAYLAQAQEYLGPRAQDYLAQAQEYLAPRAREVKKRGARLAASAVDAARPRIDDALDRVGPALDATYQRAVPVIDEARNKVQNSLLPWVSNTLHQAADGAASLELPEVARHITIVEAEPEKKSPWKRMGKILLAGGIVAVIAFAIKKFLAPTDSGWQAHEPATPYTPPAPPAAAPETAKAEDAAEAYLDAPEPAEDPEEAATEEAETATEEEATTEDSAGDDAAPLADSPYGEGSYVGTEPPEGYEIKGNERSMKFHVQGNGGFQRTIADVWFNSEEAAEAAGFVKAQR
ncbi:MAG: hypothetical protein ACK5LS_01285 [Propioniciclava sp.]